MTIIFSHAGCEHPGEYPWSSYRANAQGEICKVIKPHTLYRQLGAKKSETQTAYRELFRYQLESSVVNKIRKATNGNFVLGNDRFQKEIAQALGRRVVPGVARRPRKQ